MTIERDKMITVKEQDTWTGRKLTMELNLTELCRMEGKKEIVPSDGKCRYKRVEIYPMSKVRKLFKTIVRFTEDYYVLDEIQEYLYDHSKKYGRVFSEVRQKLGR